MTLPLTGERTLPGIAHENYWFRRHEVVYELVASRWSAPADRVLDAGCGEGYGAALLGRGGARVTGLDYDELTAAHARASYPDLAVVRGNLVQLPFADRSFDLLVSLQTIEHLWDQDAFVAECARVAGRQVLATPNRLTFPPGNICHTRELTAAEFATLLGERLTVRELLGLHHGERIRSWERANGSLVDAQLASPPADWPTELGAFVASLTVDDFEIAEATDDCLDLIAATGG
jgi:SAM-dependent methyltransferase